MDGSRRMSAQSSGQAVRSASACWNSTSIGDIRHAMATGRELMHSGKLGYERAGPEALVICLLKFEGDRPQPPETRCVIEGVAPDFRRRRAGMAVHIEP